jgi:hypothetical protein
MVGAGLRIYEGMLAEEVGFEPTVPFRTHAISSRAH